MSDFLQSARTYTADKIDELLAGIGVGGGGGTVAPRTSVVGLLGQSNVVGYDETTVDPAIDYPSSRIQVYAGTGPHPRMIAQAQDPLWHQGEVSKSVGPGMPFARRYARSLPASADILLVPTGVAGTALVGSGPVWQVGGSLSAWAAQLLTDAARDSGGTVDVIVWLQGEADSALGTDPALHQAKLIELIGWLRTTVPTAAGAHFVILGMSPEAIVAGVGGASAGYRAIDAVHRAIPSLVEGVTYVPGVPGRTRNDALHYTAAGARELGTTAAATGMSHPLDYGPAPAGPLSAVLAGTPRTTEVDITYASPAATDVVLVDFLAAGATNWTPTTPGSLTGTTVKGLSPGKSTQIRLTPYGKGGVGPSTVVTVGTAAVVGIVDNFDRPDGKDLTPQSGSAPVVDTSFFPDNVAIKGGKLNVNGMLSWPFPSNDYALEFTVASDPTTDDAFSAYVRFDGYNDNVALILANGLVGTFVGGNFGYLGNVGPSALGDVIRMEVTGNTLVVKRNGTAVGTFSVDAKPSGRPAFRGKAQTLVDSLTVI